MKLLEVSSDEEPSKAEKDSGGSESLTQEDSDRAAERARVLAEKRIQRIVSNLRRDARDYIPSSETMSLSKICSKLRKNKDYRRKRVTKALSKTDYADSLQQSATELKAQL